MCDFFFFFFFFDSWTAKPFGLNPVENLCDYLEQQMKHKMGEKNGKVELNCSQSVEEWAQILKRPYLTGLELLERRGKV